MIKTHGGAVKNRGCDGHTTRRARRTRAMERIYRQRRAACCHTHASMTARSIYVGLDINRPMQADLG